ncbi:MAG TPA: L-2-amino-thiazoline-4-carboxylic acid hydrolase [Paraburkholderia sp.]|uniref:L-2-amino-thiazoline-4-carboxylic acid hydrolase n=1 Tax=Paraburkholderia sp. TaxID=1926495 RepID=UPI002C37B2D0|nr:L-2-amino-thiazoline-4-carboxylic acid hydrolase [Paraburkholderia sp.]HTR08018.1 L-2-amino-thiazoline-4-carboxylic acid hydrolase [Paraburkholderia sp.]
MNTPADTHGHPEQAAIDNLGILARRRIEAEIIKPIYEILKRDFGFERAQAVIGEAIQGAAIASGQQFAEREPQGPSLTTFVALQTLWKKDDALDVEVLRSDGERYDYDVKRCRYAEMYHAMGLGEIGHLLSCARDDLFIAGYEPGVKLTRTTTIMQGAPRCDFRYRADDAGADVSSRSADHD